MTHWKRDESRSEGVVWNCSYQINAIQIIKAPQQPNLNSQLHKSLFDEYSLEKLHVYLLLAREKNPSMWSKILLSLEYVGWG